MRPKAADAASLDLPSRHDAKSSRLVKYPKANTHVGFRPAYPAKLPTRFPDELLRIAMRNSPYAAHTIQVTLHGVRDRTVVDEKATAGELLTP